MEHDSSRRDDDNNTKDNGAFLMVKDDIDKYLNHY